jgi:hypothetical protein
MPAYSTTNLIDRSRVTRAIKMFRSAMRAGDCKAAKYAMGTIGVLAMDISDVTYWRLHRKYKDACPTRTRRRR